MLYQLSYLPQHSCTYVTITHDISHVNGLAGQSRPCGLDPGYHRDQVFRQKHPRQVLTSSRMSYFAFQTCAAKKGRPQRYA